MGYSSMLHDYVTVVFCLLVACFKINTETIVAYEILSKFCVLRLISFHFFLTKVTLIEMLINAEKSEYPDTAINPYRKLLGTNQI